MLFAVCSIAEFVFHMLFGKSQGGRFTVATDSVTIVGLYGNVTNANVTSMKIALLCNGAHLFFAFGMHSLNLGLFGHRHSGFGQASCSEPWRINSKI